MNEALTPSSWFAAEDDSNNKLSKTVTVNAMNQALVLFHWRPEAAEIGAPAGQTHFCLLAEVDHPADPHSRVRRHGPPA